MLLGINTSTKTANLCLYDNSGRRLDEKNWEADRQLAKELLGQIESFLHKQGATFTDLTGLFVFRGPGSFTGLRIGLTVMNTIAFSENIPIVGVGGDNWCETALTRLASGENDQVVLPEYGAEARITKPKK